MTIESYTLGHIVINGRPYTSDVIIYPHRVDARWWRKEGHRLQPGDLEEVVEEKPEILVAGTGYFGHMKVPPETSDYLRSQGIEVIARGRKRLGRPITGSPRTVRSSLLSTSLVREGCLAPPLI